MKEKTNVLYEAPQVEVIEVEVEQGFATSSGIEGLGNQENL